MLVLFAAPQACSLDSASHEPHLGAILEIKSTSDLVLPLDSYRTSLRDYVAVQRAGWLLTRDCLRRFGIEYSLPESAVVSNVPDFEADNERRYGILDADADAAAARGYGVRARPEVRGEAPVQWDPTESELLIVRGNSGPSVELPIDSDGRQLPRGGCSGEATSVLQHGSSVPSDENLGNQLSIDSHRRAENDSRVRASTARWSDCMAEAGYNYKSVWDPNDKDWPDPVSDAEVATARSDVACKFRTNLVGVWFVTESAYQKIALEDNAQALAELRTFLEIQTRNAARVLSG